MRSAVDGDADRRRQNCRRAIANRVKPRPRIAGTLAALPVDIQPLDPGDTTMTALALDHTALIHTSLHTDAALDTIDTAALDAVNGGFDFGKMVQAGNSAAPAGATAGTAIGGGVGAV